MNEQENFKLPFSWVQKDSVNVSLAIEDCVTAEGRRRSRPTGKDVAAISGNINVPPDPIKGQAVDVPICSLKLKHKR